MRGHRYILQADGTPIQVRNLQEYLNWIEQTNFQERIARDYLPHCWVSTIYLGFDHGSGDEPPMLWETMIFTGRGYAEEYVERYSTLADAQAGHIRAVEIARSRYANALKFEPQDYATLKDSEINRLVAQRLGYTIRLHMSHEWNIFDSKGEMVLDGDEPRSSWHDEQDAWASLAYPYATSFDAVAPLLAWFETQLDQFKFCRYVAVEILLQNDKKPDCWRVRFTHEDWDYDEPQTIGDLIVSNKSLPRAICELFLKAHDYLEKQNND